MTIQKISGTPEQLLARRKLVEALRSNKYGQTRGVLKDSNGFCCLGVACEVSGYGTWEPREGWIGEEYIFLGETNVLPAKVQEWLGMTQGGQFAADKGGVVDHASELWQLNDSLEWDFLKIADFIEERWEVAPAN